MALHYSPHRLLLDTDSSSTTPGNMNKTRESFTGEANFDTNMVIILAALLCALICALGLNSIVRCALRCSRRFAFETPEEAAARLAAKGLKKSALHQIPIAVYGSGDSTSIVATDCPICLGEQSLLEQPTISRASTLTVAVAAAGGTSHHHVENGLGGHEHESLAVAVEEVG
ncbi:RING-H2 finger protein ATL74-like isoform X2 [Abrus precatorius]|uniref:RING-type E3 ubiquitin transferase n=1 Tax=Abrus precatorius TaxID=3816 RepID=A0A8B8MH91_ABRPR|nr:RING-H2 finger protein ATL74-like isoform X2 [Abrus precatorius]